MNALFDVVAPVLGCLAYVWYREWREAGRAREQEEVLPPRDRHENSGPGDMPVVGSSSTADERRL